MSCLNWLRQQLLQYRKAGFRRDFSAFFKMVRSWKSGASSFLSALAIMFATPLAHTLARCCELLVNMVSIWLVRDCCNWILNLPPFDSETSRRRTQLLSECCREWLVQLPAGIILQCLGQSKLQQGWCWISTSQDRETSAIAPSIEIDHFAEALSAENFPYCISFETWPA